VRRAAPAAAALEPSALEPPRRLYDVSATAFSFEPLFLALALGAGALYWRAARADPPPPWRTAAFVSGLFLIAASLNSPLETIASEYLLLMHLLQNALIADVAPLLVLLGLTPRMRDELSHRGLGRLRARWILPIWLGAWYCTHIAAFYDWALRTGWGLNVEHAILIAAGLLFWWPIVSGRLSAPAALGYLAIAFVGSSFLGLAYIFSSSPLYAFYEDAPRLWGLSPVSDQNLGGILMNGEQTLVFLLAIGWFVLRLLDEEHDREESRAAEPVSLSDL
jgi:cytochrome c oxidase assembly factor CtaG